MRVPKQTYAEFQSKKKKKKRSDKKAFLSNQCKEIEVNNLIQNIGGLFKKVRYQGIFHAKMGTIKDRNDVDLKEAEGSKKRGKNTQKNCTKMILMTQNKELDNQAGFRKYRGSRDQIAKIH